MPVLTAAVTRLLAFLLGGADAVTPAIGLALALLPEVHKVLPYLDWRALRLVAFVLGWLLLWFAVGITFACGVIAGLLAVRAQVRVGPDA